MPVAEPEFRPRPMSGRTWTVLGAIAVVFAVLYFLVAHFYNAEGGLTSTDNVGPTDTGITATVEPVSVDAKTGEAQLYLSFGSTDPDVIDADGRLVENVRVVVTGRSGAVELRFPAGTVPSQDTVPLAIDGELAQYPFDVHSGSGTVTADTYVRNSDGTYTSQEPLYVSATATGGVNGWDTTVTIDQTPASVVVDLVFQRAFSTQVFALLLLALAVLLSAAAVAVAFLVGTFRRKVEATLLSWSAALLFALPALRTFMPNGPPIGASIDIYVYLWVMAAALGAAIVLVVSWGRQTAIVLKAQESPAQQQALTGD